MQRTAVVALLMAAHVAAAEGEDDRQIAKRLFTEGRALAEQKKYIEACVLFEKSYQLDPAVGTRLNLAECAEREGKPRAAWLLWVSAADEFDRAADDRAAFARKRADALAAKLATVEVHVARPKTKGLTIKIGVREIAPAATLIERLDEGTVTVTASAPNRETFTKKVEVGIGQQVVVDIPKLARLVTTEPDEEDPPARTSSKLWWGLATASGVATLGAVGFGVFSFRKKNDLEGCDVIGPMVAPPCQFSSRDDLIIEGERWARNANIGFYVSVVGAAATTIFIVKAVRSRSATKTTTSFVPVIAPRVAGASLQLRW